VARAGGEYRSAINSLCERMRTADDTRDGYIALAGRVEKDLRLLELAGDRPVGSRDTFPFEERAYLKKLNPWRMPGILQRPAKWLSNAGNLYGGTFLNERYCGS
jgi:hypothetical protein